MKLSKEFRFIHWLKQAETMVQDPELEWARTTITDIRDRIQRSGMVTDEMIRALKNIRWGRRD